MRISDWSSDVCSSDLKRHHDAERPEDDADRRLFIVGYAIQSGERSVRVVLQDQRGSFGNLQRIVDALFLAVGNTEENKRRALWMALVMPFHRHDFGRLMLKRVEHMHDPHTDTHGSETGGPPNSTGNHPSLA